MNVELKRKLEILRRGQAVTVITSNFKKTEIDEFELEVQKVMAKGIKTNNAMEGK